MATWASIRDSLCSVAEVEEEIGDTSIVAMVQKSDKGTLITKAIKTSGKLVQDEILSYLPDIYAQSGPQVVSYDAYLSGSTYSELDTILDKIVNPDILKLAAAACAVGVLIRRQIYQNEVSGARQNNELLIIERESWEKEWKRRMKNAIRQLKLDLNADGEVSDHERPRTHRTTLQRL